MRIVEKLPCLLLLACLASACSGEETESGQVGTKQAGAANPASASRSSANSGSDEGGDPVGGSCQDLPARPNPHPEGDPRFMRHKMCLHYVELIPGIVTYSKTPDIYSPDEVMVRVGVDDEAKGSVRDRVLGKAVDLAYAGDAAEAIERGIFCYCLSFGTDAFDDDTSPFTDVSQSVSDDQEYARNSCDEKMEGLARAAMMRWADDASDGEVFEQLKPILGKDKASDFVKAMNRSEEAFDEAATSYHENNCR